jgi:hypothetical protein
MLPMSDQQPSRPCTTRWTISYWSDPDQTDDQIRVAFALDDPQGTYASAHTLCPHYENVRAFNHLLLGTGFNFTQQQSVEDIHNFMDDLDDDPFYVGLARDVTMDAIRWDRGVCQVEVTVAPPSLLSMPLAIPDTPNTIPQTVMSVAEAQRLQSAMRLAHRMRRRQQSRGTRPSRR